MIDWAKNHWQQSDLKKQPIVIFTNKRDPYMSFWEFLLSRPVSDDFKRKFPILSKIITNYGITLGIIWLITWYILFISLIKLI